MHLALFLPCAHVQGGLIYLDDGTTLRSKPPLNEVGEPELLIRSTAIEDFKSYQNLTSLNRRVLVELVESITVYDKEHIHIQYRFDQEIRNVLEYCNSVPTTETEGSTV